MVLHIQSCVRAVTATHLVMSELCEKSVGNKKSRGDHKAVEHGLENRLDVLPIPSNILKYGINKNMKKNPKTDEIYGAISMFASPVLTNIKGFSYITVNSLTPMSFPLSRNIEPYVTWTIL